MLPASVLLACCWYSLLCTSANQSTVVNPETRRPIKVNGPTFNKLLGLGGFVYHQNELHRIDGGAAPSPKEEKHDTTPTAEAWYKLEEARTTTGTKGTTAVGSSSSSDSNNDLLFVYKPSGLLSVPGRTQPDCLIARIQQDYPGARMCHRLDRDTSGVMVVALSAASHRSVSQQFEVREARKTYTCLVAGHVRLDSGVIDLPIGKQTTPEGYNRWVIGGEKQRSAQTRYTVDQRYTLSNGSNDGGLFKYTRVHVEPLTGRGQQIRLHMHALGHSLLGDTLHAPDEIAALTPRLCLHATTLAVTINHSGRGESGGATATTTIQASVPSPF